jgi:hypothetical protein
LNKFSHIARYLALAVLLHLLLALAPAMAQNVVRQGETSTIGVEPQPGDTYTWELYSDSTVNFVVAPADAVHPYADFIGATNSSTVEILWKKPGTYFFKVHALNITGCTNNLKMGIVKVLEALPTATMTSTTICVGETASITVELTGTAPWSFTYTDGTTIKTETGILSSPYELKINPNPKTTTTYTITTITDKWGTNSYLVDPKPTVTQEVKPKPNSSQIYKYGP